MVPTTRNLTAPPIPLFRGIIQICCMHLVSFLNIMMEQIAKIIPFSPQKHQWIYICIEIVWVVTNYPPPHPHYPATPSAPQLLSIWLYLDLAQWASCQIRKIAGAHGPVMPGTFPPSSQVSDPDMHHGTCVTHVPWCMPGSLTSGFLWNWRRGETFPAFPAHAQPAIFRIW